MINVQSFKQSMLPFIFLLLSEIQTHHDECFTSSGASSGISNVASSGFQVGVRGLASGPALQQHAVLFPVRPGFYPLPIRAWR